MKLFAPDGMLPETKAILEPRFEVHRTSVPDWREYATPVLWVGLKRQVDAHAIGQFGGYLKAIATPCTGLTHIDTAECERRDIKVISLQGSDLSQVWATAEHTVCLLLSLLRRVVPAAQHVHAGKWDRSKFQGWEIRGKRVAIIGCGRIGKQVSHLLRAFGAHVYSSNSDADTKHIMKMLQPINVVILCENYEPEKRGKYSHKFFGWFKGAMFVNTARGELIDEGALLAAIDAGKVAGAALDVVADEYKPSRMLADMSKTNPNLIVTPHIAGYTHESVAKTEAILARKLLEAFA